MDRKRVTSPPWPSPWISKTKTLHVHHAFLYISLSSLNDYNVKVPNFTFFRGQEHKKTTFSFLFLNFDAGFRIKLRKHLPTFVELNETG